MVSTRSKSSSSIHTGEKREHESTEDKTAKKPKVEKKHAEKKEAKLDIGEDGQVGLKKEESAQEKGGGAGGTEASTSRTPAKGNESEKEQTSGGPKETPDARPRDNVQKVREVVPEPSLKEPQHGTLESGHVYFLYRPKIDAEEVDSIDDISKFHILLIPTSTPYDKHHFHRVIGVGRKRLPDPDAKRDVIWGMVDAVGSDKAGLKAAFGAYDYETKTRGTRHQDAARPAARGHYILHSPQDTLADSPDHNRQRDFKILLAYEITTPVHEDFGRVQADLDIAEKGAIVLQVKNPDAPNTSATNRNFTGVAPDKKAEYPSYLSSLFASRRFIPANPPAFLDQPGSELLLLTSPHKLSDSLGVEGDKVEHDMDEEAKNEQVGIDGALKELGLSKKDVEIDALEGVWT